MKELLKKYLADDQKVSDFMKEMAEKKIFTAGEEKLDERYAKLKASFDAKNTEHQQALTLIEQLKAQSTGNEELTGKIAQYEQTITALQKKNAEIQQENAIKMALLEGKAKAEDVDYLMFKLKSADTKLKVNEDGEVTNINEVLDTLKKNFSSHFEPEVKKTVKEIKLPEQEGKEPKVTKEQFEKMSYKEKNELFNTNKELYKELRGE